MSWADTGGLRKTLPSPFEGEGSGVRGLDWIALHAHSHALSEYGERGARQQPYATGALPVGSTTASGRGARSAISTSSAVAVQKVRPVMQWLPAQEPSAFCTRSRFSVIFLFQSSQSLPPLLSSDSLICR